MKILFWVIAIVSIPVGWFMTAVSFLSHGLGLCGTGIGQIVCILGMASVVVSIVCAVLGIIKLRKGRRVGVLGYSMRFAQLLHTTCQQYNDGVEMFPPHVFAGEADLKEYLSDKRFSYSYRESESISEARNEGIEKAKGKYIAFGDVNVVFSNNLIEEMFLCAEKEKAQPPEGGRERIFQEMERREC